MSICLKIAAVQMDVTLGDKPRNLDRITSAIEETSQQGTQLTVFPECAVTGYCFDSLEEALPLAESVTGPSCEIVSAACERFGCHAIVGFLEADGDGLFNACALIGPEGIVGNYRKIHLPFLGIDRFTTPGDRPFAVHQMDDARIGMNICYDSAFPEAARCMALDGADLIALPTNFPPGAECMAEHVVNTRAMENKVFYACVNRVGIERGFAFIGHSKICDTSGRVLAAAPHTDEAILYADLDLEQARTKRIVRVPEKHIIDRFADRRPEMYGRVAAG
ncbi:MAG: carbon-nitrogen hydrolase family protein [Pirellulaceae bacterium]|jgi:predicted amidohydrolase|nr:carbon-nitrogen hydrolase family protein [Pirellulaceae bacterium]MDP6721876.1 carbon-nitrogen hydrolase family protein [Pirellulaceae bacterium]